LRFLVHQRRPYNGDLAKDSLCSACISFEIAVSNADDKNGTDENPP
jgi:hypothetical protein